jgi:hypothetical protein
MVHTSDILKKLGKDTEIESISISSCSISATLRTVSIIADVKSSLESKKV